MDPDTDDELHVIRAMGPEEAYSRMLDLPKNRVPWTFLASLDEELGLIQLESALSVYQKKDTLLVAGTNSGKTLVVILLALLQKPGHITIMVSPFKRLQESMAKDMWERYNLNVVVINEETTRDVVWWKAFAASAILASNSSCTDPRK
ncbi:hypothetical protein F5878DRAFT_724217 [Lentinula raphanica]|uniref:DEAD/DEAH-box helicase domain-containing protein n=1 Tax=Lentinula raphanica TaxID=153919 RepID=A0AA38UFF8_9AGAR|nr:hypothetical protein F5878DRAFT_724217 [Lentinula raphanica]